MVERMFTVSENVHCLCLLSHHSCPLLLLMKVSFGGFTVHHNKQNVSLYQIYIYQRMCLSIRYIFINECVSIRYIYHLMCLSIRHLFIIECVFLSFIYLSVIKYLSLCHISIYPSEMYSSIRHQSIIGHVSIFHEKFLSDIYLC